MNTIVHDSADSGHVLRDASRDETPRRHRRGRRGRAHNLADLDLTAAFAPLPDGPGTTSVYLYRDSLHRLIYVGVTGRGIARQVEHNRDKAWWPYVARQDIEHYPTRGEAVERERYLIATFRPPFNAQHNPESGQARAAYEATAQFIPTPEAIAVAFGARSVPLLAVGEYLRTPVNFGPFLRYIDLPRHASVQIWQRMYDSMPLEWEFSGPHLYVRILKETRQTGFTRGVMKVRYVPNSKPPTLTVDHLRLINSPTAAVG